MKKIILLCFSILIFFGCKSEPEFDLKKQNQITEISNDIFSSKKINFKEVVKLIEINSAEIFNDTLKNKFRAQPIVYSNPAAKTYFKIYYEPNKSIHAIAFFKNGRQVNISEYYDNGQVQCLFTYDHQGIRNGKYECFHKNGSTRKTGNYLNGKQVGKEKGFDINGKQKFEFNYDTAKQ